MESLKGVVKSYANQQTTVFANIFTSQFNGLLSSPASRTPHHSTKNKETNFNDYCPVAPASTIMNCIERLIMAHICARLSRLLTIAYRKNGSTENGISLALHSILDHLDVRMLFSDYSSTSNTLIPN